MMIFLHPAIILHCGWYNGYPAFLYSLVIYHLFLNFCILYIIYFYTLSINQPEQESNPDLLFSIIFQGTRFFNFLKDAKLSVSRAKLNIWSKYNPSCFS